MDDQALSQAALKLRNIAPQEWEAFVLEVERITQSVGTIDLLSTNLADVNNLMHRQGWARGALWLLRTFKECDVK